LSTISDDEKKIFLKYSECIISNESGKWNIQCTFPSNVHDVLGNIMIEKILWHVKVQYATIQYLF